MVEKGKQSEEVKSRREATEEKEKEKERKPFSRTILRTLRMPCIVGWAVAKTG